MNLGTDPEFFIFDTMKNIYVSGSEVFGDKEHPWTFEKEPRRSEVVDGRYLFTSYPGTKIFRDGFGVEINVNPSYCRETLAGNVQNALKDAEVLVKAKNPFWELRSAPTVPVSLEYLETLPKDVKVFGCDPAMNAYRKGEDRITLNGEVHPLRYAGGHMHFGDIYLQGLTQDKEKAFSVVKLLDLTIGLPLSLIFREKDEFLRREYYGKAGEFRFQPWGIEYRTPSPRIWNHPVIASLVFGVGRSVLTNMNSWLEKWTLLKKKESSLEKKLLLAINEGEGGEELLQTITSFYKKETIDFLSGKGKELFKLNELSLHKLNLDGGKGFVHYMSEVDEGRLIAPAW